MSLNGPNLSDFFSHRLAKNLFAFVCKHVLTNQVRGLVNTMKQRSRKRFRVLKQSPHTHKLKKKEHWHVFELH